MTFFWWISPNTFDVNTKNDEKKICEFTLILCTIQEKTGQTSCSTQNQLHPSFRKNLAFDRSLPEVHLKIFFVNSSIQQN